jgi:MYXO-CTERM domain-containing protein
MQGYPMTRTASSDGRWVYTLYSNPGGYAFVHALDTVRGVAHCVGLPVTDQNGLYNVVLTLHGKRLAVHWRSGRPWYDIDTTTWRVSPAHTSFPWWTLTFALLPLAAVGALLLRRRRRGAEIDEELADLLALPPLAHALERRT